MMVFGAGTGLGGGSSVDFDNLRVLEGVMENSAWSEQLQAYSIHTRI